jgi:hypothetical protein
VLDHRRMVAESGVVEIVEQARRQTPDHTARGVQLRGVVGAKLRDARLRGLRRQARDSRDRCEGRRGLQRTRRIRRTRNVAPGGNLLSLSACEPPRVRSVGDGPGAVAAARGAFSQSTDLNPSNLVTVPVLQTSS